MPAGTSTNAFHLAEEAWPRVYRPTSRHRLLLGGLGGLTLAGGLAGAVAVLVKRPDGTAVLALVAAAFALLGAFLLAALRVARIVLFEDGSIEIVELGRGRRRFRRDDIAGVRTIAVQYGIPYLALVLRGPGRKPFRFGLVCRRDDVLDAWFATLPDLDAADLARSEAELRRSALLGRTEEERAATLATARRISHGATAVSIAAALWGWFHPRPYAFVIAVLIVIPLATIALLLAYPGRYSVEGRRNEAAAGLELPLILPGMVLMLRSLVDFEIVDHEPLLSWSALGGLVLVATLAVGERALRRRLPVLVLLLALIAPYAWGSLAQANVLLDGGEGRVFAVAVLGKRVTSGKHPTTQLRLAPWGPVEEEEHVDVPRALYRAVEVGATVCVRLRGGRLGARWYRVERCR